jgi:GLPGLI family protein
VRFNRVLTIALIPAIVLCSCKSRKSKYIDQGEIHYNINYVGKFAFPTEVLPKNLVISFKKDKVLFEMLGFGNSGIINLANHEKKIYDTYYNFFGVTKVYYEGQEGELFPGFESMKGLTLKKTSKTAVICGYNCKNAEVRFAGDSGKVCEIWYTDEIKVKDPNASTPFSNIPGVLMNFFLIMDSSEFHFTAETVYNKELPDEIFNRREHYKKVSKNDIRGFMHKMLEYKP